MFSPSSVGPGRIVRAAARERAGGPVATWADPDVKVTTYRPRKCRDLDPLRVLAWLREAAGDHAVVSWVVADDELAQMLRPGDPLA